MQYTEVYIIMTKSGHSEVIGETGDIIWTFQGDM